MDELSSGGLAGIDIPSHRRALGAALSAEYRERYGPEVVAGKRRPTRTGVWLAAAASTAVVAGLIAALVLTMLGTTGTRNVKAMAMEWYKAQEAQGDWEHIDVIASFPQFPQGVREFEYELWRNSETGAARAEVRDPKTGEVIETLIAIRRPDDGFDVYTSKPAGEKSILEHGLPLSVKAATDMPGPLVAVWGTDDFDEALSQIRRAGNPLEVDIERIYSLKGWISNLQDGDRGLVESGKVRLDEIGREATVLTTPESRFMISYEDEEDPGTGYTCEYYLDPGTGEYLGVSQVIVREGKRTIDNRVLYKSLEFTDRAPDMSTDGMRRVEGVTF